MKKLGRNLGALLGDNIPADLLPQDTSVYRELPVNQLKPSRYQPRKKMTEASLEALAESIKSQGIIQPLIVKKIKENQFEIIAGERRWRAAQAAKLLQVPVVVHEALSDQKAMAIALIENIQREDLNVVEEALALQRLIKECDMTHEQVAEAVGRSRTAVSNLLRLLALSNEVRVYLENGELEMGHARALLSLSGSDQVKVAKTIIEKQLTVRKTEELVRNLQQQVVPPIKRKPEETNRFQPLFEACLSTPVKVNHSKTGQGKLIISYHSVKHLEELLQLMQEAVGESTETA